MYERFYNHLLSYYSRSEQDIKALESTEEYKLYQRLQDDGWDIREDDNFLGIATKENENGFYVFPNNRLKNEIQFIYLSFDDLK